MSLHASSVLQRAAFLAPLLLIVTYPLFCQYDFSKSPLWYYDFLAMNSNILWFVLVMVAVSLLALWKREDLTLPSLFAIAIMFSVAEVATNYPMIWRDVFLHGSGVKAIIQDGHIVKTWNSYPQTHPGSFLLWLIVTLVAGLGIFESNVLVLAPVGTIVLLLLLLVIYRKLSIPLTNTAVLLTFLLMNFSMNEFMFIHFNTRLLSLIYVLVFLLFFLRREMDGASSVRRLQVLPGILLAAFALVISHVLNSLLPVAFLGIYLLLVPKGGRRQSALFLSCAIIYAAWTTYVAYPLLVTGVRTVLRYFYINLALDMVSSWSPLQAKAGPFFAPILRGYEKALFVTLGLVSLYCVVKLRKQARVRILGCYLFSVFAVYGITFFSSLTWISALRAVHFAALPLASLPIILLIPSTNASWKRRILVATVIVLVVPHFILVHEPSLARSTEVGSLPETSGFLVNHRGGQVIVSLNDFAIYYCFYEPFYDGYDILPETGYQSLQNATDFLLRSRSPSMVVVDRQRPVVDWSLYVSASPTSSYEEGLREWNAEVYSRLDEHCSIIYTTSLETIYTQCGSSQGA